MGRRRFARRQLTIVTMEMSTRRRMPRELERASAGRSNHGAAGEMALTRRTASRMPGPTPT